MITMRPAAPNFPWDAAGTSIPQQRAGRNASSKPVAPPMPWEQNSVNSAPRHAQYSSFQSDYSRPPQPASSARTPSHPPPPTPPPRTPGPPPDDEDDNLGAHFLGGSRPKRSSLQNAEQRTFGRVPDFGHENVGMLGGGGAPAVQKAPTMSRIPAHLHGRRTSATNMGIPSSSAAASDREPAPYAGQGVNQVSDENSWFVAQQSLLENDLARVQAKAELGRERHRRESLKAQEKVEEGRRRRESEVAMREQHKREVQAQLDAQMKAQAAHMMAQAEAQRTPPQTAGNIPPSTSRPSTSGAHRTSNIPNMDPKSEFMPPKAFAKAFNKIFGGVRSSAPAASTSPYQASKTSQSADKEDFERRKAQAEARKQWEKANQAPPPPPRQQAPPPPAAKEITAREWETHERKFADFENNTPSNVRFSQVPWPPQPDGMLRAAVKYANGMDEKKVYRKLTLRWHPDKFINKYGGLLAASDHEEILNEVKTISQILNRAWDTKAF